MAEQSPAWVSLSSIGIPQPSLTAVKVDLGGSLAVASRGLYATGVSTDLNGELSWNPANAESDQVSLVTYLNSGGQVGDVLNAVVKCDKCESQQSQPGWKLMIGQLGKHWHTHPYSLRIVKEK